MRICYYLLSGFSTKKLIRLVEKITYTKTMGLLKDIAYGLGMTAYCKLIDPIIWPRRRNAALKTLNSFSSLDYLVEGVNTPNPLLEETLQRNENLSREQKTLFAHTKLHGDTYKPALEKRAEEGYESIGIAIEPSLLQGAKSDLYKRKFRLLSNREARSIQRAVEESLGNEQRDPEIEEFVNTLFAGLFAGSYTVVPPEGKAQVLYANLFLRDNDNHVFAEQYDSRNIGMTGILGLPMNAHEQELDKSDVQTYFEENNLLFSGWMNLTAFAENTVEEPDWAIAYKKRYEAVEKNQEI